MSDLTTFRDHARKMSTADHRPDCSSTVDGHYGPREVKPSPDCPPPGCMTLVDRELWLRLADEVDSYVGVAVTDA